MNVFIYALIDPRTNEIRYIGKTNNPKMRYYHHTKLSCLKEYSHKNNWVKSLLMNNLKPILQIIDECSEEYWQEHERHWIKYYRYLGYNLTNSTDGGDGLNNPTEEVRKKMSLAHIGKNSGENNSRWKKPITDENRINLVLSHLGKKHSESHKRKIQISGLGKKKSKETSSKFVGVTWVKEKNKWKASIMINRKNKHLGYFKTDLDAYKKYESYLIQTKQFLLNGEK